MSVAPDWPALMRSVVRDVVDPARGSPRAYGHEFRYGRRGSLSVDLDRGVWFDHEAGVGGGVVDLVEHVRGCGRRDALAWLRDVGHLPSDGDRSHSAPQRSLAASAGAPGATAPRSPSRFAHVRAALVRELWDASVVLLDGAGRRYLESRRVWVPFGYRWVRWLAREAAPAPVPEVRWWGLPRCACGALVCAYVREGAVAAVSIEALDASGVRLPARWRRTCGSRSGAAFRVRESGEVLHVAEGEIDALAVARRETGSVYGLGGTSGVSRVVDVVAEHRRVVVHADAGGGGGRAAVQAVRAVRAAGLRASIVWCREDPAADWEIGRR